MKRKEGQLMKLVSVLATLLVFVLGVIVWLGRDTSNAKHSEARAEASSVMIGQAQPTTTPSLEPVDTQVEDDWGDVSTPVPEPRTTHIQRDISSKLRVDAEAVEPGVLKLKIAGLASIAYTPKTLSNLLFYDKDSKRSTGKWGEGTEVANAKGEVLLTEPGRITYSRYALRDTRSQWDQVAGYLTRGLIDIKWHKNNQQTLNQELAFLSREEAARQVEACVMSIQPKDFPYTVEAVEIAAVTYAQWDSLIKDLYKEQVVNFKSIPREGAQDFGGDGLYVVTLHFSYEGVPLFPADHLESISYGDTTSRVQGNIGMNAYAVVSAAGIVELDISGLTYFADSTETPIISLDQAVESMAAEYKEFPLDRYDEVKQYTIDRIFLTYVMLRFEESGDSRFAWHPMWCFIDDDVRGGGGEKNFGLYLDAVSGKSILTM